jgi:hypothetical protein
VLFIQKRLPKHPITTAIQIPLYPPWDINKSPNPPTAGAESKNKNLDDYTSLGHVQVWRQPWPFEQSIGAQLLTGFIFDVDAEVMGGGGGGQACIIV